MAAKAPEGFVTIEEGIWQILARPGEEAAARSVLGRTAIGILLGTSRAPARGWESRRAAEARDPSGGVEVLRPQADDLPAGRGITMRVPLGDGRAVIVKALHRGGLWGRLRGGFHGRDRLVAEMRTIEDASRRGVPVPALAFGATARLPEGNTAGVLATWEIAEAVGLPDLLRSAAASRIPARIPGGSRNASIARAGRAVRRAHDLGLDHADLNIGNVLVAPLLQPGRRPPGEARGEEPIGAWLIDLGVSPLGAPLDSGRRAANLVRLLRSAEKHLGRDPRRLRAAAAFMHGYLATERGSDRDLRRDLLPAIRRRLPFLTLHRLGWAFTRSR